MINLAPIRYARVLSEHGGPIEKIDYFRREETGEFYHANAWLSRHLNLQRPRTAVFSSADGSGTHASAAVARYMAVSEALERWALYYLKRCGMGSLYGFDIDSTSNGMAAYPGLFDWQARKRAHLEAVERYCLLNWWEGRLETAEREAIGENIHVVEIENPQDRNSVVLLWRKIPGGFYAYGHAAGGTLQQATERAMVELERSTAALGKFHADNPAFELGDITALPNSMEQRIVFFSLPEGHRQFAKKLEGGASLFTARKVRPIVDKKVEGPWSRYATVWRVLYPAEPASGLNPDYRSFA